MKGIILAGGSGTRLYPLTKGISKQLLPVYDKPMIYYPLSVLMLAGIRDILVISTPEDLPLFERVLGDGSQWGIKLTYAEQPKPEGIAQAFLIGEEFIKDEAVCLILGDNIFYGHGLPDILTKTKENVEKENKATILGYAVSNPSRYGVAGFDENGNIISIEEKPANPKSNFAVVGLYFYPNDVIQVAKSIVPSDRGELEITAVNEHYLNERILKMELLGRGFAWLDAGTHASLLEAGQFVETIEKRTALKIACLEEIAYQKKYITKQELEEVANKMAQNAYADYLKKIIKT